MPKAESRGDSPGWTRQQLQVPDALARKFRDEAGSEGHGGVKVHGAAALAIYLGMPDPIRHALVNWLLTTSRRTTVNVTPEAAWSVFLEALAELPTNDPRLRVVHPEVDKGGHTERVVSEYRVKPPNGEGGRKAKSG